MKDRDRDSQAPKVPPVPGPAQPETPNKRPSFPWKVAGGGAVALLLVWFVIQNSHGVEIRLLWWRGTFPLVLVMATVAVAGIVAWETLRLVRRRRVKKERAEG